MALATNPEIGAPSPDGRARAFREARRHSALVRTLRILFPALGLGVVAIYSVLFVKIASFGPAIDKIAPKILPEHLTMENPRYEGFTDDGGSYVFTADAASQSLTQTNLVALTRIKGTLIDGNKVRTTLTATRGEFDTKANTLELLEGIDVASESGLKAKLERATVFAKDSVIVSEVPVVVEMPAGTVRSERMTIRQKLREMTFAGAVVAKLNAAAAPAQTLAAPAPAAARPLFGSPGQPIDVTANRLDVNDAAKTVIFSGTVKAVQGNSTITTPELRISYDGDGAAGAKGAGTGQPVKLQRIGAREPVVITRGTTEQVTSRTAEFDAPTGTAVLMGNVVITALPDRRAQGDRAEFNSRTNTALLTGAVSVTQGQNMLHGRRLFLDRASGLTQLSAPTEGGTPAGRVKARFYRKTATGKAGPEAGNDKADAATGSFKTDPSAPVDIEADTLDVNDPARVATFRGTVAARQGTLAIGAQEMVAHYSGQMGIADQGAGQSTGASEITHIDARGRVTVTSAGGQTATGDWAKFDVKSNKAVLGGSVVLTQGRNVVNGRQLVIDLATGESVIGNGTAPAGTAASPEGESRPKAVFYPKELKDKAARNIAPAAKALEGVHQRQSEREPVVAPGPPPQSEPGSSGEPAANP